MTQRSSLHLHHALLLRTASLPILTVLGAIAGCGPGSYTSTTTSTMTTNGTTTQVTVVTSSTANDQLSQYYIQLQSLTLTNQSGKTITLQPARQRSEYMHVNGAAEPLLVATIPQGVYTAASAQVAGADYTCIYVQSTGSLTTADYYNGVPPTATVSLPAPITVTGASMGLALDLLVSPSAAYSNCSGGSPSSIAPTFNLRPFALSSQQSSAQYGRVLSLDGQVTSVDANAGEFQVALPQTTGGTVSAHPSSSTSWQGIANLAGLTAGSFVDLDGALQPDGSVVVTRVAVMDPAAVNVQRGPIVYVGSSTYTELEMFPRQGQGKDQPGAGERFNFAAAAYRLSGQFANLQSLPFTPAFNATNLVPGQEVYISSPAFNTVAPPDYLAMATTITLMPQTVDGTIVASSSSGTFNVYTVSLATYDLFQSLAIQPGYTTPLANPGQLQVYVDSSTRMLNSAPLVAGATVRFYGLVFNDNGTLRMDCAQITDGVPE